MSYDARCGTIKLITPDLMVPELAALNTDFVVYSYPRFRVLSQAL